MPRDRLGTVTVITRLSGGMTVGKAVLMAFRTDSPYVMSVSIIKSVMHPRLGMADIAYPVIVRT